MQLIIIGSGTGAVQPHRGPAGYILKRDHQTFLLDGGAGTIKKCLEAGISYKVIDKIFYTHLHPDHTLDLITFLFATKHTPGFKRTKKLEIYGPSGFLKFYKQVTALFGAGLTEATYRIQIQELEEGMVQIDGWQVEVKKMQHTENAIGYRFEMDGKVLVYSGDTDYGREIIELAAAADVLVLECSFPDQMKVAGHLTPTEAGKIAAAANVKKLILTHLYPPCDAEDILTPCQRQFSGTTVIAEDLMRVDI